MFGAHAYSPIRLLEIIICMHRVLKADMYKVFSLLFTPSDVSIVFSYAI